MAPNYIIARAMLAQAYDQDGQWDSYTDTLADLEKMPATHTPELMFLAGAQTWVTPRLVLFQE